MSGQAVVFRGGPVLSLDVKGRLSVPARHRDTLVALCNGQLIVCKHPDGCLSLFPEPVYARFEAFLRSLTAEHDNWKRVFIGSATELEIDSGSRVLLPPELREWAQMGTEVKFMGVGSHFELWDKDAYAAREALTFAAGRPEPLRNYSFE
jgi:MraZ protein